MVTNRCDCLRSGRRLPPDLSNVYIYMYNSCWWWKLLTGWLVTLVIIFMYTMIYIYVYVCICFVHFGSMGGFVEGQLYFQAIRIFSSCIYSSFFAMVGPGCCKSSLWDMSLIFPYIRKCFKTGAWNFLKLHTSTVYTYISYMYMFHPPLIGPPYSFGKHVHGYFSTIYLYEGICWNHTTNNVFIYIHMCKHCTAPVPSRWHETASPGPQFKAPAFVRAGQ